MELDRNGLEIPDREECLEMIRSATVGRLGIHTGALPSIVPVNFALTPTGIVIRTATGTKLDQATRNAVVAFEVDAVDPQRHTGWSVNVIGIARRMTDPDEIAAAAKLPLAHWAPGAAEHYLMISLDVVSGRRIAERRPVAR